MGHSLVIHLNQASAELAQLVYCKLLPFESKWKITWYVSFVYLCLYSLEKSCFEERFFFFVSNKKMITVVLLGEVLF